MVDSQSKPMPPLAIIGVGCLFPGSSEPADFWSRILGRFDAIRDVPPTHWKAEDYLDPDPKSPDRVYAARGGFLEPVAFNPTAFGIPPSNLEATDASQLLGLMVAQQALADCGYSVGGGTGKPLDRSRVSVILGVTGTLQLVIPLGARLGHPIWKRALAEAGVDEETSRDVIERIGEGYVGWQENSFPGLLGNVVAGRIANRFDLGGTNCVVDAACASSLSAIHLAAMELATGRADLALTGGVDTFNDIFMFTCFSKTPALSPTGSAKPFDASADGTVLGEGLGMVVLKRLEDARRDGDRVYAVLKGIGSSSDGKGGAIYAPRREGQVEALRTAYRVAGVTPDTVELVEAHGTGTKVGDATEAGALAEVYRSSGRNGAWCALGSIKSQIGHTKAAAGAAGLIKAALALHHKVLPPTIKVSEPLEVLRQPDCPLYVNTQKRPWLPSPAHPRRAAVSAFGFGGSNFHAVLEEASPEKASVDWPGDVQILAFSGGDRDDLRRKVASFPTTLSWPELHGHADRSRRVWKADARCRLVLVVQREKANLPGLLAKAVEALTPPPNPLPEAERGGKADNAPTGALVPHSGSPLCGSGMGLGGGILLSLTSLSASERGVGGEGAAIFLGQGRDPGKLAVLFPGQGAQYPGMLRDLSCHFPAALNILSRVPDVAERVYPRPAFAAEERARQDEALRATDMAQPAIGAVSLGAYRVLESFGLRGDAFAGHSYGELVALCAAGRLSEEEFFRLSALRGRLMAEAGRAGDPGGMLAVKADEATIRQVLKEEGIDLVLANKNAPAQTVLSGPTADIDRAAQAFARRKVSAVKLAVAAAFHSPLVAPAREALRAALDAVPLPPGKPVFANSTASPYPDDPAAARDLLGSQLARPVEWVNEVRALYDSGVRTFVEVGPGARLAGLVESIVGGEAGVFSLDSSSGKRDGFFDLACCLAWLAARGYAVDLSLWDPIDPAAPPERKPAHTVELCGANYVKPRAARPPRPRIETPPASNGTHPPKMNEPRPTPEPTPAPAPRADAGALGHALEVTRESLAALQRMQEQTANLHRQFLDGQDLAHRSVQMLLEQQQRLLQASLGQPVAPLSPPPPLPAASLVAPAGAPRVGAEGEQKVSRPAPVVPAPAPVAMPAVAPALAAPAAPPPAPQPPPAVVTPSAVTPPPVTPAVHAAASTVVRSPGVENVLLEVIAEKTGYPAEMLELGMSLDADLGIDSIKRVEILSAIQERLPDAPQVKPEHLGTLHTLADIAGFLASSAPAPRPPSHDGDKARSAGEGAAAPQHAAGANVQGVLIEVIAEKTGYPAEMLELGMSLDADLGIDSIKRVEILSAIQERLPDAPQVKPEHLGTLHTLADIAGFLASGGRQPAEVAPAPPVTKHSAGSRPPLGGDNDSAGSRPPLTGDAPSVALERSILRSVLLPEQVREPVPLAPVSAVWIAGEGELADALAARLKAAGYFPHTASCAELAHDEPEDGLAAVVILAPDALSDDWLRDTLFVAQRAGPSLQARKGVLVTVSRMDGAFGLAGTSRREPIDGGLAGLAKTVGQEWPAVHAKAVDLGQDLPAARAAEWIAEEMFLKGPAEVGISAAVRVTPARLVQAVSDHSHVPFGPGDVVVVSGGARGVTAECAVELARAFRPTLVLLGRSPAPDQPDDLESLHDPAALKRELSRRNPGTPPREVAELARAVEARREIRATLARVDSAGGKAVYRSVDVADAAAVAAVMDEVRRSHGPIRGIVHGAGVLADARIEDKTPAQFDAVFRTKVHGLRALLAAVPNDELSALAIFSSSTARFGRTGQVDYAMANEVLNKIAWHEAGRRKGCQVVSINWGPWDGGMVTPALKELFKREGIGVIPLADGARLLVDELRQGTGGPREVVVLAAGSRIGEPASTTPAVALPPPLPAAFERTLDVESCPVLADHVLDGRPVLPTVLMLEWLAHAAVVQNPGLLFHGFDDLRVLQGVPLDGGRAVALKVGAAKASRREGFFVAPAELRSTRPDGRQVLHARAEIVLASSLPSAPSPRPVPGLAAYDLTPGEAYQQGLLFHGPRMHAIERIDGCDAPGVAGLLRAAPPPAEWLAQPLRPHWLADPLAIDGAMQLMILWTRQQRGAANLPCHMRSYRQYRRAFPADGVRAVATVKRSAERMALCDIDFLDADGRLVARLEGYEVVIDPSLEKAYRRNVPALA